MFTTTGEFLATISTKSGSCAAALHVFGVAEAKKLTDVPLGEERQVAGGVAIAGKTAYAGTRAGAVAAVDVGVAVAVGSGVGVASLESRSQDSSERLRASRAVRAS